MFDFNTSIEGFREQCKKGASKYAKIPDGIAIKEENINGLNSEFIVPDSANSKNVILYVHGGGYVSGSCNDHRGFVSKFAKYCGITTLQFEYRLAPEHPFPDGLNGSAAVYKWILDKGFHPFSLIRVRMMNCLKMERSSS